MKSKRKRFWIPAFAGTTAWLTACAIGSAPVWGLDPVATPGLSSAVSPAATHTFITPFAVYSGQPGRSAHYVPSGYMGDIGNLTLSGAFVPSHEGKGTPLRVVYTPKGPKGWAGVYWQSPANNWGDRAGKTGYDLTGAKKLTFWARGEKGGEKIREVRIGGIVGRYPDSDVAKAGPIVLSADWKRFEIDLTGKDLKHIIGGFGLSVNKYDNVGEVTFYINDIAYELPRATPPPAETAVVESPPAPMAVPVSPSKDIQIKADDAGLRVSVSSNLLFSIGKSALRPESEKILTQLADVLKAYPKNNVLIEGHTDSTGGADFNLKLSRLRAESVQTYLVKKGGFDLQRFRIVGYGKTKPIADNATTEGRAINRRVEVIILKNEEPK
jgi:outer membrane protein OmpA-like peptidoglycan-associated protein